jgi:hypothetical protein
MDATVDHKQIEAWWTETPDANIGMETSGLIVVDIDGPDNPWPDTPGLDLASGPINLTPGGGCHLIYRLPAGKSWRNTAGKLAPHVDTRTAGGYIVVPPSRDPRGQYSWAPGCALDAEPSKLPKPPDWLVRKLDALATGMGSAAEPEADQPSPAVRHFPLSPELEKRAIAYLAEMPPAISGQRGHDACYKATTAVVHGFGIPPERAFELLREHYNPRCQLCSARVRAREGRAKEVSPVLAQYWAV